MAVVARLILCVATAWLACAPAQVRADTWKLDPDHTELRFSWDHMGLSRQSGEIQSVYGRLDFTPTDPQSGSVEVTALLSGLSTGVEALDTVLASSDYFDAARFPRITFKSTAIAPTGPKSARITGDLTIRDVTHPVVLETIWNFTGEHPMSPFNPIYRGKWVSGFSARTTIARSAWGLTQALPLVSDQIEIQIEAEFLRVD